MKVTLDLNGLVTGFFEDSTAPIDAISVSDADFNILMEYQDSSKGYDKAANAVIDIPKTAEQTALETESSFRMERDKLLQEADIMIYKLEDNGQDATAWRTYRQSLRDATLAWVLPTIP